MFFSKKKTVEDVAAGVPAHENNGGPLRHLRFGPEKKLLDGLFEQFGLEQLISHVLESGDLLPLHHAIQSRYLRLTPLLAPRLFEVLGETRERLRFTEDIDLYVFADPSVNAAAFHRLADDQPHLITLTSETIRSMSDDELRFIFGHEIGHIAMSHYRVMVLTYALGNEDSEDEANKQRLPRLLEMKLAKWMRMSEISADRYGFVASGERMDVPVSAFFKMASGLGPEHLRFDLSGFLDQLGILQSLDRRELLARFSHPVTPVRVRALQLFSERGGAHADSNALNELEPELNQLAALMDFESATDLGAQAREFLVSGGLLAAYASGEPSQEEQELLIQLLLQFTGDPEAHISAITSVEDAESRLSTACEWLRENTGQERLNLYWQLAHIVAVDGVIDSKERAFMMRVAEMLAIPERAAKQIQHDVLSQYVKTKSGAKQFGFGFGQRD